MLKNSSIIHKYSRNKGINLCVICGCGFSANSKNYLFCDECVDVVAEYVSYLTEKELKDFRKKITSDIQHGKLGKQSLLSFISDCKRRGLPGRLRKVILIRANHQCEQCGGGEELYIHHIKPYSLLGPHSPDNLIVLCRDCHKKCHQEQWKLKNQIYYFYDKKLDDNQASVLSKIIRLSIKNKLVTVTSITRGVKLTKNQVEKTVTSLEQKELIKTNEDDIVLTF